jgi:hypothetical protein
MKQELEVGPVLIQLDFLLVIAGAALIASPSVAICLALAIGFHELGHALVGRWISRAPFRLVLQLAGGRAYVRGVESRNRRAIVLAAGPIASGALVVIGAQLYTTGFERAYDLFYAALVWTGYQIAPYPTSDGGQLLRISLEKQIKSATAIWRVSWVLGLAFALGVVMLDPAFLAPAIWLTGMAVILGRSEAGYVRHLDAWAAWEKGDHAEVVRRVRAIPDYLDKRDRGPLLSLGVISAIELADRAAVEELSAKLPAHDTATIEAATWLLRRDQPFGAKLAERALDSLDADVIKRAQIDGERWSEMAFRLAVYEANALRPESALGVLDRALELGYVHKERIEAEPAFARLTDNPRWKQILERL